jgi:uncharacterized phiE125 gp8 family phage protein
VAAFTLKTAPAIEPLTLDEVKAHCRIDVSDDDDWLTRAIGSAREQAEVITRRALMPQTWTLTLDTFPTAIELAWPPLQSVTSITYREAIAGAPTVLSSSSYIVDAVSEPGWIQPAYGFDWPQVWPEINAITVEFVVGWTTAGAVPNSIKQWLLLAIADAYMNRERSVTSPTGRISIVPNPFADGLLDRWRVLTY